MPSTSEPDPSALPGLVRWQWGLTALVMGLALGVVRGPWGVWLPLAAYALGSFAWARSERGRLGLVGVDARKRLAWGAGWRGGVAVSLLWGIGWMITPHPDAPPAAALGIGLLLGAVGAFTLTGLTLIGMDAARGSSVMVTSSSGRGPANPSGRG